MLQHLLETGMRQTMNRLVKPVLRPAVPISVQRTLIRQAYRTSIPPRGCRFQADTLAGRPVIRSSFGQVSRNAVLYLHGGGYIIGSAATHKGITGHLAKTSGCMVVTPDYRLAPEHPFPAALDDAESAWQALIAEGFAPEKIAIAGDSAGGGLAIALAMRLRDNKQHLPSSLTVFSPWADLTGKAHYSPECEPVLNASWIAKAAEFYAGQESLYNPLLSPVFGNFEGLPPLLIQVGSQELLLNDAERVAETARKAGVKTQLEVFNSLWHVFHVHSGQLNRATAALQTAGEHIREHQG